MGGYFRGLKLALEVKMILWAYVSMNYLNNMYMKLIKFPTIRKPHEIMKI